MESSRSDDGRLNLTVDVFSDGVVGPQALGNEGPREVRLEGVAQSLERFEAARAWPKRSKSDTRAQDRRHFGMTDGSP